MSGKLSILIPVLLLSVAPSRFEETAFAQVTAIDAAWLSSHGPAPYPLAGDNSTYVLQTDVTSDGSAFKYTGNNIVFDLNGHTVTYANLSFTGVTNPGFEQADPSGPTKPLGWDLSLAPHAYRQDSAQKLYYDDFSLHMDNPANDGVAEEVVRSSPVLLPAPGSYAALAQVQGGGYSNVQLSLQLEGAPSPCTNTVTNMNSVYQGTDMSIGITCEVAITAPTTVRARLVLTSKDPAVNVYANIDEVDIRPVGLNGIAPGVWNKDMREIKNGAIVEGASAAAYSHAVAGSGAKDLHDMKIVTNGINSSNISDMWRGSLRIYNNHLEAHGKLPLHRHYMFAMIDLSRTPGGNEIFGNTLLYGPHVGIWHGVASGENTLRSAIYNNTIKTRIVATNGFAINAGSNVDIYGNTIQPIQGHGIGIGTASNNVKIHDNLIEPRSWPCSEYSSYGYPNSAHGIRAKDYGSTTATHDIEIYGNRIIGRTTPQKPNCYTEVVGITDYLEGPNVKNVSIHDNFIDVQTDDYRHQHAIAQKVGPYKGDVFNNTYSGNHILLEMSDGDGGKAVNARLVSNTFQLAGTPSGFHVFRYGYNYPSGNTVLDARLGTGLSLKDIYQTRTYSPATDLTVSWYLTVTARSSSGALIPGATITATDRNGKTTGPAITDASGMVKLELPEYLYLFDTSAKYQQFSPYTVRATKQGCDPAEAPVTVDSSRAVGITLSNCQGDISPPTRLRVVQ